MFTRCYLCDCSLHLFLFLSCRHRQVITLLLPSFLSWIFSLSLCFFFLQRKKNREREVFWINKKLPQPSKRFLREKNKLKKISRNKNLVIQVSLSFFFFFSLSQIPQVTTFDKREKRWRKRKKEREEGRKRKDEEKMSLDLQVIGSYGNYSLYFFLLLSFFSLTARSHVSPSFKKERKREKERRRGFFDK